MCREWWRDSTVRRRSHIESQRSNCNGRHRGSNASGIRVRRADGPTRDVRALAGALRGLKTTLERTDMPIGPALALAEQALGPVEMAAANSPGELAELSLVRRALERAAELR
jgi:hypothetical protein